jgi:hypothetical protein
MNNMLTSNDHRNMAELTTRKINHHPRKKRAIIHRKNQIAVIETVKNRPRQFITPA